MASIVVNGIKTCYERHGEGYPVVCIHGSALDRRQWASQVGGLAGEQFEIITYDVRGHGDTTDDGRDEWSMELFADDLHELIGELGLNEQPIICGHSMGGMIVLQYVADHPNSIAGAALLGAPLHYRVTRGQAVLRYAWPAMERLLPIVGFDRFISLIDWVNEKVVFDDAEEVEDEVAGLDMSKDEYRSETVDALTDEDVIRMMNAGLAFEGVDLDVFDVPTLVVVGENDGGAMLESAEIMDEQIDDSEVVLIEDAGHAVNADRPDEFNRCFDEFFTSHVLIQ